MINADDIVYESIDSSDTCRHERYYGTGILAVRKEDIDEMQTIEERKKGKWIIDGHHIECNRCGEYMCKQDREGDEIPRNFCPSCGAVMIGEQDYE